ELPGGEDAERPAPGDELSHDLGVESGPALGDAAYGIEEVAHGADALIGQVPDRSLPVGEQLGGVGVLDVLREDENRRPGRAPSRLDRGAQALVAEARRAAEGDR